MLPKFQFLTQVIEPHDVYKRLLLIVGDIERLVFKKKKDVVQEVIARHIKETFSKKKKERKGNEETKCQIVSPKMPYKPFIMSVIEYRQLIKSISKHIFVSMTTRGTRFPYHEHASNSPINTRRRPVNSSAEDPSMAAPQWQRAAFSFLGCSLVVTNSP